PSWAFSVKKTPLHNPSGNASNRGNALNPRKDGAAQKKAILPIRLRSGLRLRLHSGLRQRGCARCGRLLMGQLKLAPTGRFVASSEMGSQKPEVHSAPLVANLARLC